MNWIAMILTVAAVLLGAIGYSSRDDAQNPRLRYTGRWAFREGAMVTINSGSVLEARFRGKRCVLHFDTRGLTERPQIYVQVDGRLSHKLTVEDTIEFTVAGKEDSPHDVRLTVKAVEEHQRNWEHLEGAVKFTGIETDRGLLRLPDDKRPLVEFVGDSLTAGVLLGTEGSTTERMDGLRAHPTLVGEKLGARVSQVGFGRLGLTIPGNGEVPLARESFGYCFKDAPVKHQPAMVVIHLGTNDMRADPNVFAEAYRDYLAVVRRACPKAVLVCVRPFGGFHADVIKAEVERARAAGDADIHYVDTSGWLDKNDYTDGIHPSAEGHRKAAEKMAEALKPLLKR